MISKFGVTISGAPDFAYALCAAKVDPMALVDVDLSGWRLAFNGSERIRPKTLDAFAEAFGIFGFSRAAFYGCYGLAEATLLVSGGHLGARGDTAGAPIASIADQLGHADVSMTARVYLGRDLKGDKSELAALL